MFRNKILSAHIKHCPQIVLHVMLYYIITFTVSGNFMSSYVLSRRLTVGRRLLIASGLTRMLMALALLALLWAAIIWSTMLP
ncbi:hypothetical protein SODG_005612 [Sodalis praecaptivus]|nr:hypothetical protein NVIRENTERO_04110 [Sodalis praecaptivus]